MNCIFRFDWILKTKLHAIPGKADDISLCENVLPAKIKRHNIGERYRLCIDIHKEATGESSIGSSVLLSYR